MIILLTLALAIAACYSGGMYLITAYRALKKEIIVDEMIETWTFHLAQCFILAVGFLYLGAKL